MDKTSRHRVRISSGDSRSGARDFNVGGPTPVDFIVGGGWYVFDLNACTSECTPCTTWRRLIRQLTASSRCRHSRRRGWAGQNNDVIHLAPKLDYVWSSSFIADRMTRQEDPARNERRFSVLWMLVYGCYSQTLYSDAAAMVTKARPLSRTPSYRAWDV